jgi:hypothetical protein
MVQAPQAEPVAVRLERIEAKLDRLIGGPPAAIVTVKEAMYLTGCRSISALYRLLPELGVRPYVKGKYRRLELENAIAKHALNTRLSHP